VVIERKPIALKEKMAVAMNKLVTDKVMMKSVENPLTISWEVHPPKFNKIF